MDEQAVRKFIRGRYAGIAREGASCCGPSACCGGVPGPREAGRRIGYSEEEMNAAPPGSNLGLGCGNPTALASLAGGEVVLDLGCGAGFDCFLAAREVGPEGRVIGVDMTPEMIEKARENAARGGFPNVEFRLGEIENLPVADGSVDVILSNCVINLSPDKARVFAEAYRVLRPGGRVMISDLVLSGALPEAVRDSLAAYAGCISGAVEGERYLRLMKRAGFRGVRVVEQAPFPWNEAGEAGDPESLAGVFGLPADAVREAAGAIVSVRVCAVKPEAGS